MMRSGKHLRFSEAVEEHGADGIKIMTDTSPFLASGLIYIVMALMLIFFIWSFFGKADVIITVDGQLEPKSEMRRVYIPTPGELVDIYVSEGTPVTRGDVLARIKATGAIKAATDAEQAKMQLERVELEMKVFPQKKQISEKELENISQQIREKKKEYEQLKTERFKNLPASRQHRLNKTRLQLEEAENNREIAKRSFESYKKLYETEGNGGISKKETEEKENQYIRAEKAYQTLKIDLETSEIEFSQQDTQAGKKIGDAYLALLALNAQYDSKKLQNENEEKQIDMQHRAALAGYEAASVVTFDDLDQDNFLKVRAPVSGVITFVTSTQPGDKVKSEVPLVSIAPADAERSVFLNIPDKDRGLLKTGQAVKLKFAAFPFYRHGFVNGTLEYISPDVMPSKDGKSFYRGRVGLKQDYLMADDQKISLRYGMTATAEIVVQKRRLIDLALDPFRSLKRS